MQANHMGCRTASRYSLGVMERGITVMLRKKNGDSQREKFPHKKRERLCAGKINASLVKSTRGRKRIVGHDKSLNLCGGNLTEHIA